MAKPAGESGTKKLVMDEKVFKKIEALVAAYGEAVKVQKKMAKGGPAPKVDPAVIMGDLGTFVAKSWGKLKDASGIKDAPVVKKVEKAAAKTVKTAAKAADKAVKNVAKAAKPAAKKAPAKKAAKPAPKPKA